MSKHGSDLLLFTPAGQMGIFWRILHMITNAYGNYPAGQLLVALTMVFLHNRGMNPTLSELCEATGLPKATVSRYVAWQLRNGYAKEEIDPHDRRRRVLMRTEKGRREFEWQNEQISDLFKDVRNQQAYSERHGKVYDSEDMLYLMKWLTEHAAKRI